MHLSIPALVALVYFASEVLLTITKHARKSGPSRDANSWRLMWIVITGSIWLGILAAQKISAANLPDRKLFTLIGVLVFVAGLVLRGYSVFRLGRFFTVNVAIAADHQLIETGPYRFVRHPSYTGALLAIFGFTLTLGNWLSIAGVMLPIFAAFVYRMNVEERALIAGLGDDYRAYISRTKRLLPLIY